MEIEIVDTYRDFLLLRDAWTGLLQKSPSNSVFLSFDWLDCWWKAYGKVRELNIILVKEANTLIAIAPLMSENTNCAGLPARKVSFIYNDNASCADFILSEKPSEALRAIIKHLEANKNNWDLIELQNIAVKSLHFKILENILVESHFPFGIKDGLRSPFVPVDTDWKTFFSGRSSKFRKNLKNIKNRIPKAGAYAVEKIEKTAEEKNVTENIAGISAKSWKAKCKRDIARTEEDRKFFEILSSTAEKNGWLAIWLLKLNEKPVSYEYLLKYNSKVYTLRSDFDEAYKNISPGTFLTCKIMEHYFADSVYECDLCGHDDAYKRNWTTLAREHSTFVIYNDNAFGKILYCLDYKILYRAKMLLKKIKFLRKIKRILTHLN